MQKNKKSVSIDKGFIGRHPVLANVIVIALVAFLGIWIVYLSLQIFTKHGYSCLLYTSPSPRDVEESRFPS